MDDVENRLPGQYGVVIVPPGGQDGTWLVTVARWDGARETYVASSDGPLLETRADALAEAERVMDWLAQQRTDNLMQVWRQMQEQRGIEEGLNERFLRSRNPWNL